MSEYTTETGYYVLVDGDGRVMAKADVPVGTHPVDDSADSEQCYDVDTRDELEAVEIDPHYYETF